MFIRIMALVVLFALSVPASFAGEDKGEPVKAEVREQQADTEKAAAPAPEKPANFVVSRIGGMEVIALLDAVGVSDGTVDLLVGAEKEDLERAARPGALKMSINAFVVKLNGKTILFDTGMPVKDGGGILPALKNAGLKPEDIDAVVITHFHFDHVGGLVHEGKKVYPKAELYVPRVETDKWSDPGTGFLLAYQPWTIVFEADREFLPGVTSRAAYGHTPGHTVFEVEADGKTLLIIGDLIHIPGVQLANPGVAMTYDVDPARAVAARKRIFDMAAERKLPVASMHIPFPGMGTLAKDGEGYTFTGLE